MTEYEICTYRKRRHRRSEVQSSKSPGHDNISAKLARDSAEIITNSLTVIFNKSLNKVFPCMIYKAGDRSDCGNYRPISVIPVIAKVFEKIVCPQLSNCLKSNDILTNQQTGFRVKQSTQTCLLGVTNTWCTNMDYGLLKRAIFFRPKKRF